MLVLVCNYTASNPPAPCTCTHGSSVNQSKVLTKPHTGKEKPS